MSKVPTSNDPMVVLTISGGGAYFLPLSQAVALVPVFATARRVDYSWSDKCYKFYKASDSEASVGVKVLLPAQLAQLHLEDDAG